MRGTPEGTGRAAGAAVSLRAASCSPTRRWTPTRAQGVLGAPLGHGQGLAAGRGGGRPTLGGLVDGAEVGVPRGLEVRSFDVVPQRLQATVGQAQQPLGQRRGAARFDEDAVDAVAHLRRERPDAGGQDGQAVGEGEQRVLRGRAGAVGQHDGVVGGHELGDAGRGDVPFAQLHVPAHAGPRRELADPAAGSAPQLPGDGEPGVEAALVHLAQRLEQQVQALVLADDAQAEQPDAAVTRHPRTGLTGQLRAAGQVRGQVGRHDAAGAVGVGQRGLRVGVDDDAVDGGEQPGHEQLVAGFGSCGSTLCATTTVRAVECAARIAARTVMSAGTCSGTTWAMTTRSACATCRPVRHQDAGEDQDSGAASG